MSIYISKEFGALALGKFSYALAIISPIAILTGLQLRHYSVSQRNDRVFQTAKFLRLTLPTVGFILAGVVLLPFSPELLLTFIAVALIKWSELWSEICYGWLQAKSKLGLIASLQTLKYGLLSLMLALFLILKPSLSYEWIIGMMAGLMLAFTLFEHFKSEFHQVELSSTQALPLVKETTRLALATFLTTFTVNLPRYFLEREFSLNEVAYFSALFYFYVIPHLALNYLNIALLKRMHSTLTVKRFVLITVVLLILSLTFFAFCQHFAQSLMFTVYGLELIWKFNYGLYLSALVFLGGMLSFLYYYLISAQNYRIQLYANIVTFVITFLCCYFIVPQTGIEGALLSLVISNVALTGIYLVAFLADKHKQVQIPKT